MFPKNYSRYIWAVAIFMLIYMGSTYVLTFLIPSSSDYSFVIFLLYCAHLPVNFFILYKMLPANKTFMAAILAVIYGIVALFLFPFMPLFFLPPLVAHILAIVIFYRAERKLLPKEDN